MTHVKRLRTGKGVFSNIMGNVALGVGAYGAAKTYQGIKRAARATKNAIWKPPQVGEMNVNMGNNFKPKSFWSKLNPFSYFNQKPPSETPIEMRNLNAEKGTLNGQRIGPDLDKKLNIEISNLKAPGGPMDKLSEAATRKWSPLHPKGSKVVANNRKDLTSRYVTKSGRAYFDAWDVPFASGRHKKSGRGVKRIKK